MTLDRYLKDHILEVLRLLELNLDVNEQRYVQTIVQREVESSARVSRSSLDSLSMVIELLLFTTVRFKIS